MRIGDVIRPLVHMMAAAAILFGSIPAEAMNVSPMVIELASTGARSTGRIQVLNVIPQPLPFEVRVYRIDLDAMGEVKETPADADFIVFPPQGLIQHNQRQMIRLQWVGGALDSSRGYYVAINQLPVQLDPNKVDRKKAAVDVQVVYHMKVLVTVAPPGAAPKVAVESARPVMIAAKSAPGAAKSSEPPVPGVAVVVRNTGKRYAMLAGVNWLIEGKGLDNKPLRVAIPANKMGELLGAGYVPALNGRRVFEVPTGVRFADGPISVKFSDGR